MADPNSDAMNAMLREAAGRGRVVLGVDDQQAQPPLPRLGGADYGVKDDEPLASDQRSWEQWAFSKRVVRLLDAAGRLPGEEHYDRSTSGPADPDGFNLDRAVRLRRQRWRQRGL